MGTASKDLQVATAEELKTKRMIIYMIRNKVNGKVYIGQTTRTFNLRYGGAGIGVERVLGYFKNCIKNRDSYNNHLYKSIQLHGVNNFEIKILDHCETIDELNERESFWINSYNSNDTRYGYNRDSGGNNITRHPETIKKWKEAVSKKRKDKKLIEIEDVKNKKMIRNSELNGYLNISKMYNYDGDTVKIPMRHYRKILYYARHNKDGKAIMLLSLIIHRTLQQKDEFCVSRRTIQTNCMRFKDGNGLEKTRYEHDIKSLSNDFEINELVMDRKNVSYTLLTEGYQRYKEVKINNIPLFYAQEIKGYKIIKCDCCNLYITRDGEKHKKSNCRKFCRYCQKIIKNTYSREYNREKRKVS